MTLKKGQLSDAIWILLILLFLFTPLGFYAKVQLMRLFSFAPSIEKQETSQKLTDYNWQLVDVEGNQRNFNINRGEVIIINHWATWCPPCIAEMPSLVALHEDYGEKVKFIFLANDDSAKVRSYLNKKDYAIPVFFENTQTPTTLKASSLPTTYILDKKGNIVLKEIGAADWNAKAVKDLLDTLLVAQ